MFLCNVDDAYIQNRVERFSEEFPFGMFGLYIPCENAVKVISCPEHTELNDQTYPVEASSQNIEAAQKYAESAQREPKTAIDAMNASCLYALRPECQDPEHLPAMLFYFPAVFVRENRIFVHENPCSCSAPEIDGDIRLAYPVIGYGDCRIFITSGRIESSFAKHSTAKIQTLDYFVHSEYAEVHEGDFVQDGFWEQICQECKFNSLLRNFCGLEETADNSTIRNDNFTEAINFELFFKECPEIALVNDVNPIKIPEDVKNKPKFLREEFIKEFSCYFSCIPLEDVVQRLLDNIGIRAITGFVYKDVLWGPSSYSDTDGRFLKGVGLEDSCSYISNHVCVPSQARVTKLIDGEIALESKHIQQTARNLALYDEKQSSKCLFPEGYGLFVLKKRVFGQSKQEQIIPLLKAGFLPRFPDRQRKLKGTKKSLYGMISPREALDILIENTIVKAKSICGECI